MIFVLSYSGLGTMSANRCPQADFRAHLDMQVQALATSPEYFGLWGVEAYRSHNVDEEILNCMGMLLRHYCIEGKTGRMLSDPYELKHVANPDFTDGTQGWQVQAAEPSSVRTDAYAGYGTIQGRYGGGGKALRLRKQRRGALRRNPQPQHELRHAGDGAEEGGGGGRRSAVVSAGEAEGAGSGSAASSEAVGEEEVGGPERSV
jgi:hypothetical protein